jgi:hypothetical protein
MAVTFFGVATQPADNAANAGPGPRDVTPPGSMLDGDLVIVSVAYDNTGATLTVSAGGGQTWTALAATDDGVSNTQRFFWCRFNGTWSTNPSFTNSSGTNALSVQMFVFRPSTGSNLWGVDYAQISESWPFASGGTDVGRTGAQQSMTNASGVAFCRWSHHTALRWTGLAGTGWSVASLAGQYRNTTGFDQTSTYAYNIISASGAVAKPNKDLVTGSLSNDVVITEVGFYEYSAQSQAPRTMAMVRQMRG